MGLKSPPSVLKAKKEMDRRRKSERIGTAMLREYMMWMKVGETLELDRWEGDNFVCVVPRVRREEFRKQALELGVKNLHIVREITVTKVSEVSEIENVPMPSVIPSAVEKAVEKDIRKVMQGVVPCIICGKPASAGILAGDGKIKHVCEKHLQIMKDLIAESEEDSRKGMK